VVLQINRCSDEDDDIIIARCGRRRGRQQQALVWELSFNIALHSLLSGVSIINHARWGGNGNFARTRGVGPPEG
jgi:hypothetical protein